MCCGWFFSSTPRGNASLYTSTWQYMALPSRGSPIPLRIPVTGDQHRDSRLPRPHSGSPCRGCGVCLCSCPPFPGLQSPPPRFRSCDSDGGCRNPAPRDPSPTSVPLTGRGLCLPRLSLLISSHPILQPAVPGPRAES